MNVQRIALAVIAIALLAAEGLRPTHWAPKKASHQTEVSIAASGLDTTFLDGLPPIDMLALGSIDTIGYESGATDVPITNETMVPRGATIAIVGWCADPIAKLVAGGVFISVDGRERIDGSKYLGIYRPDVETYYSNPAFERAGFRIVFPAALLGTGTRELQFGVIAHDRRGFFPLGGPIDVTVN